MIKVLIVDDSAVMRQLLTHVLGNDPGLQVIGAVEDGEKALAFVKNSRPDVITMDVHMPKMDGFQVTRRIMETTPVPIIILSASWDPDDVENTFKAVEAGAMAVLEKPQGPGHPSYETHSRELIQTVKVMSEVKVVRRRGQLTPAAPQSSTAVPARQDAGWRRKRIIVIGASTGGPLVLRRILSALPADCAAPIVVVQHIAPGFLHGMVDWLRQTVSLPVQVAGNGELLLPGHVYFAPDGAHTGVDAHGRIVLSHEDPDDELRPSVSHLFHSVLQAFAEAVVAVLLTGMGRDGAAELRALKNAGAMTIIQDKDSAVVYGMPGEALRLDAAVQVLTPEEIATVLPALVTR